MPYLHKSGGYGGDSMKGRRKRSGPSPAKARKMLHEGLESAGDGFHSERQRRFIAARAARKR